MADKWVWVDGNQLKENQASDAWAYHAGDSTPHPEFSLPIGHPEGDDHLVAPNHF